MKVMPLFHIHGIVASMLSTLASGGRLRCRGLQCAGVLALGRNLRPTWYSAVPTMHQLCWRAPTAIWTSFARPVPLHPLSSAACRHSAGATGGHIRAPVIEAYGMTEASHQMAPTRCRPGARPVRSAVAAGRGRDHGRSGRACRPEDGSRRDAIQGAAITAGYERNPAANQTAYTEAGSERATRGYLDPDGYLLPPTGACKELINRGGEKVAPREVEEIPPRASRRPASRRLCRPGRAAR